MTIDQYLEKLSTRFKAGISTEHSYRGDLQNLLETLIPGLLVTNEPSRVACGAPDYILTKKNIPVGYIEAKDLGADLDNKLYKEQFDRYNAALHNLIITNYLDFRFYRDGVPVTSVSLAAISKGKIVGNIDKFQQFETLIRDFAAYTGQTIRSAEKLAKMMAGKARMLANVIENALVAYESTTGTVVYEEANNSLRDQLSAFRDVLIHDIDAKAFADIYAQTITYGMFAARLHDPTLDTFSRQEAAELIPKSNPFLRKLFQYIAGYDLDDRLKWIVDALADIYRATDVAALLKNFGKSTQQNDPIIHFYETFLGEYDPKLRKSRGVWYTPEPVVNFIVRAVDDILKTEFGLKDGLADISKTKVKVKIPTSDNRLKVDGQKGYTEVEQEVHKVQILDPACGTGTFLAEIIKQIYKKFEGQQGIWNNYVEEHLIPRLNGFEILMASYAMAHLKLDMLLAETGYKAKKDQRFRVFLTNSLEEYHPDTGTLFAGWLSTEANEANYIKRDTPVMVVLGNPPYSIVSSNLAKGQRELVEKYKFVDGIKIKEKGALQFEKIINDDYIKFISLGEKFIVNNENGILAYINNHNFLDSPQLRGLRWSLANSFDSIYIIDLHGNFKKKEVCPDGTADFNVFDIQQGVSINIFIKKGEKRNSRFAKVFLHDYYGTRTEKYNLLTQHGFYDILFSQIEIRPDNYLFVSRDVSLEKQFSTFIDLKKLFFKNSTGIISARDNMVIDFTADPIVRKVEQFRNSKLENKPLCESLKISLKKGWDIDRARIRIQTITDAKSYIKPITYRPFDNRRIFYEDCLVWTTAKPIMRHFTANDNTGLIIGLKGQVVGGMTWNLAFVTKEITDFNLFYRGGINVFPLYLYSESTVQSDLYHISERTPNLNAEIVDQIAEKLGVLFTNEKETTRDTFAPIDILDYIYAVLHSPTYREKYKEFLKIDFPRVPYPKDQETFWKLIALGGELRQIHLLESPVVDKFITIYPQSGSNAVVKVIYESEKVWINDQQYFEGVPVVAWNFYIGGYQPAQKWLKDRKGRELSFEDIQHYQKIIVALTETDRIMKEIKKIEIQ